MTAAVSKPMPDVDDPLSGPFWAALDRHEIVAQRCRDCGMVRWPIAETCPRCLGSPAVWERLPSEGRVWSHVEYVRAFHPAFAAETPYVIALVDVVEGVRLPGRLLPGARPVSIGAVVVARFVPTQSGPTLLAWEEVPRKEDR
ncbi:Zn-ribbon domain-containing OB-fold protein [Pseudonocardia xishanensis]|uniref:OB-fold protein n=1 Tax=Pseudonocardia xishanensis TaxID=630995 RepID=A0ABP8RXP4_9PSEU